MFYSIYWLSFAAACILISRWERNCAFTGRDGLPIVSENVIISFIVCSSSTLSDSAGIGVVVVCFGAMKAFGRYVGAIYFCCGSFSLPRPSACSMRCFISERRGRWDPDTRGLTLQVVQLPRLSFSKLPTGNISWAVISRLWIMMKRQRWIRWFHSRILIRLRHGWLYSQDLRHFLEERKCHWLLI